jgi:hypothetical protein
MDHLGGLRRGARSKVALLHEGSFQAPARCIECDACSGDATSHHENVKVLFGQAVQRVLAAKSMHIPSLPHEI